MLTFIEPQNRHQRRAIKSLGRRIRRADARAFRAVRPGVKLAGFADARRHAARLWRHALNQGFATLRDDNG